MRNIVVVAMFIGLFVGGASAAPSATKIPNANYVHKAGSNCQTICRQMGNQQICNTTCF